MSDVFYYIAGQRQPEVQDLCLSFGYPCSTHDEATNSLMVMADYGNDAALKEIMNLHPEKDLILELFAHGGNARKKGCPNCQLDNMLVKTNQADGGTSTMATPKTLPGQVTDMHLPQALQQTNTLLIMGIISAFIIALVVYKK